MKRALMLTTDVASYVLFSFSQLKEETVRNTCNYFSAQLFNALEWEKELVLRRQQEVQYLSLFYSLKQLKMLPSNS